MSQDEWEKNLQDKVEAAMGVQLDTPMVAELSKLAPSLDKLAPVTRLQVRDEPKSIWLNEWTSNDWDRVTAYGITHMMWGQFSEMMLAVHNIIEQLEKTHPQLTRADRSCKALHMWAEKKLTNEPQ